VGGTGQTVFPLVSSPGWISPLLASPRWGEGHRVARTVWHVKKERAVYVLGAEDSGIPPEIMAGHTVVHMDTPMCLNVAVAGSLVMFHRTLG